jgi:hypothetical protein
LLVLGDLLKFKIKTLAGSWRFDTTDDFSDAKNTVFDKGFTRDTYSTSTVVQIGRELPVRTNGQAEHWGAHLEAMLRKAFESTESAFSDISSFQEAISALLGEHKDEEGLQRRADRRINLVRKILRGGRREPFGGPLR